MKYMYFDASKEEKKSISTLMPKWTPIGNEPYVKNENESPIQEDEVLTYSY